MAEHEILGTVERLWPDVRRGPWLARLTYGTVGGQPGVLGVEIYAVNPDEMPARKPLADERAKRLRRPRRITTAGLRLPLAELLGDYLGSERARRDAMGRLDGWPMTMTEARAKADAEIDKVAASRPKRGRPPVLDPSHFEDVASIYLDASARGESPLSAIAAEKGVARSTAAKWASQCRERGLLARTVQGKGSGSGRIEKRGRRS